MTTGPTVLANLGLTGNWPPGYNGWGPADNVNLRVIDALYCFATPSAPLNAPPGSPTLGDRYIVGTSPTGAWAGQANACAVWTLDDTITAVWQFIAPKEGFQALVMPATLSDPVINYLYRGAEWQEISGIGGDTLAGLEDVTITEGPGIDGFVLTFNNSTSKWIAVKPPGVFGRSGTLHSTGLVPDPGSVAGASRFLREDGGWNTPFFGVSPLIIYNDTVSVMSGAGTIVFEGGVSAAVDTAHANTVIVTGATGGGGAFAGLDLYFELSPPSTGGSSRTIRTLRNIAYPIDMAGSDIVFDTPPGGAVTVGVYDNGSLVAGGTCAGAASVGAWTSPGAAFTVAAGHDLKLSCSADTVASGPRISLTGTRA